MRKILIAGAGHGGLACAYMLAKKGYDVTVAERRNEKELGWDWHDMMVLTVFDDIDMKRLPPEKCSPAIPITYISPNKKTRIFCKANSSPDLVYIDRKELLAHLIQEAKQAGVKFLFGCDIQCCLWQNNRVAGICYEKKGKLYTLKADLTVDAAGLCSPVRASLPADAAIENHIPDEKVFFTYRAYFERTSKGEFAEPNCVYLFHCRNKGMDWAIVGEDFVDFLVGSFGKINDNIIDNAITDFLQDYREHTNGKLTRGGCVAKIPLTKTLSRFVANGYAAVGDSALMTEAMSGSGISLSMSAGCILAQTILKIGENPFTVEALWEYQYRYLKEKGMRYLGQENVRNMLQKLSPDDIDGFLNNGILGEKEIRSGGISKMTTRQALQKLKAALPYFYVVPDLVNMLNKNKLLPTVKNTLPEQYDENKVREWQALYEKL